MASNAWSEKILHLLRRMNNFYSAGSSRSSCCRFEIDGAQVGWIPPHVSSLLTRHADVFLPPQEGAVALCPSLDCYERRSEAVNEVLETFRTESSLKCLRGWRDEVFLVSRGMEFISMDTLSATAGNSLVASPRSITKQTYPGLLDNMVAGGLAAGVGIKYTLIKECEEEACIPADITMKAHPVSTVSYTYEDEEGVFPESQFVFDLELPLDFKPCIGDGEVQEFYLLSIEKVKDLLATDDFKPNSAMVVLDFLIRHSFIEPDTEPYYQEFVTGLHQTL